MTNISQESLAIQKNLETFSETLTSEDLLAIQKARWGDGDTIEEAINLQSIDKDEQKALQSNGPKLSVPTTSHTLKESEFFRLERPIFAPASSNTVESLEENILKNMTVNQNLSQETVAKIRFYNDHPDLLTEDSAIAEYIGTVNKESEKLFKQKYPNKSFFDEKRASKLHLSDEKIASSFISQFDKELQKRNDLNNDQKTAIRYALYNPDSSPPEIANEMKNLRKQTIENSREKLYFPDKWQIPLNSYPIDDELAFNYTKAFEKALNALPLTELEKNKARNLNNFKDIQDTIPEQEKAGYAKSASAVASINNQILTQMKKRYHLPSNWQPDPLYRSSYTSKINGSYIEEAQKILNKFLSNPIDPETKNPILPLSKGEIEQIRFALIRPDHPEVSEQIKGIASLIRQTAISIVQDRFGLPTNWTPKLNLINAAILTSPESELLHSIIQSIEDDIKTAENVLNEEPNSSEKRDFMDLMTSIISALADMKMALYEIEMSDSEKAKEFTAGELESRLSKLDQEAKMREQQKDSSKGLKIFTKILFGIITVGAVIFAAPAAIAAAGAIAVGAATTSAALTATKFVLMVSMTITCQILRAKEVDVIGSIEIPNCKWLEDLLQTLLALTVAVVACSSRNPAFIGDILANEGNFLIHFFDLVGWDDKNAEIVAMALTMAISIGASITAMVKNTQALKNIGKGLTEAEKATAFKEGGLGTKARNWFKTANESYNSTLGGANQTPQAIASKQRISKAAFQDFLKSFTADFETKITIFTIGTSAVSTSTQVAESVITAKRKSLLAEMEAYIAEIDALIKMISQMVSKMYEDLSNDRSFVKWATDVQDQIDGIWEQRSNISSKLHQSIV